MRAPVSEFRIHKVGSWAVHRNDGITAKCAKLTLYVDCSPPETEPSARRAATKVSVLIVAGTRTLTS